MYCPSCGANIKQQDQLYCQECGTTLPASGGRGSAIVPRPPGIDVPASGAAARTGWLHVLPGDAKGRLLTGAGVVVVAVILLYIVVNAIVSFFMHVLLPVVVLAAVVYAGYLFVRSRA
jgi:hypothetical protein